MALICYIRDRLNISLLILSEFKRICKVLFYQYLSFVDRLIQLFFCNFKIFSIDNKEFGVAALTSAAKLVHATPYGRRALVLLLHKRCS